MSCHGTCRTPLLEVNVAHVIDMDDWGSPKNPLVSYIDVFARVYRWELALKLRKPGRTFFVTRDGSGNIPHLFTFDASVNTMEARQYSGDFNERMHDDPYYGQKPQ